MRAGCVGENFVIFLFHLGWRGTGYTLVEVKVVSSFTFLSLVCHDSLLCPLKDMFDSNVIFRKTLTDFLVSVIYVMNYLNSNLTLTDNFKHAFTYT